MNAEKIAEKLVSWIRDTVVAGGCNGVLLGMSGGIDSSVAAELSRRAFPEKVLGVLMPCYSIREDEEHALAVARRFSIPTKTVILDSVFDTFFQVLPDESVDAVAGRRAKANLKARLRMIALYCLANQLGYMVVGSSNRSELSLGYFTKYGDGGVDIMPLGNLVKGQVRELAAYLDIPREIIDKPPSAGLWQGQTDEGDFGFRYDELDHYLATGEASPGVKDKIEAMKASAAHKRRLPPLPPF